TGGLVSTLVSIRAILCEKFIGRTITAMLDQTSSALSARVNILKEVKVNGQWKLCPEFLRGARKPSVQPFPLPLAPRRGLKRSIVGKCFSLSVTRDRKSVV